MAKQDGEFLLKVMNSTPEQLNQQSKQIRDARESSAKLILESSKALAVLNGASAAAILGLTQALVRDGNFGAFKRFVLISLTAFLVGAMTAALVPFAQAFAEILKVIRYPRATYTFSIAVGVLAFSIWSFAAGAIAIVCGFMNVP